MNSKSALKAIIIFSIGLLIWLTYSFKDVKTESYGIEIESVPVPIDRNAPPSLQMYESINKWSKVYKIPRKYAFGIAKSETGYNGPFHWNYNHKQISPVGAVGPMQIMPSTGRNMWRDSTYESSELKNNIDFNVKTSMKLLRKLYNKYGNWKLVFGCYNTGRPMINGYALKVYNHKINWNI